MEGLRQLKAKAIKHAAAAPEILEGICQDLDELLTYDAVAQIIHGYGAASTRAILTQTFFRPEQADRLIGTIQDDGVAAYVKQIVNKG